MPVTVTAPLLSWTQIACLHIFFFCLFKVALFIWFRLSHREKKDEKTPHDAAKDKPVDGTIQRVLTEGFMPFFFVIAVLGYSGKLDWAVLYPVDDNIARIGSGIAALGSITLVWVHIALGKSWSGVVSKQVDQKLITTGPYALARHPMYAFSYFQPLGLWLLTNNWLMAGIWFFQKLFLLQRIRREDLLMVELFGEEYAKYHKTCGALLPFKQKDKEQTSIIFMNKFIKLK